MQREDLQFGHFAYDRRDGADLGELVVAQTNLAKCLVLNKVVKMLPWDRPYTNFAHHTVHKAHTQAETHLKNNKKAQRAARTTPHSHTCSVVVFDINAHQAVEEPVVGRRRHDAKDLARDKGQWHYSLQ